MPPGCSTWSGQARYSPCGSTGAARACAVRHRASRAQRPHIFRELQDEFINSGAQANSHGGVPAPPDTRIAAPWAQYAGGPGGVLTSCALAGRACAVRRRAFHAQRPHVSREPHDRPGNGGEDSGAQANQNSNVAPPNSRIALWAQYASEPSGVLTCCALAGPTRACATRRRVPRAQRPHTLRELRKRRRRADSLKRGRATSPKMRFPRPERTTRAGSSEALASESYGLTCAHARTIQQEAGSKQRCAPAAQPGKGAKTRMEAARDAALCAALCGEQTSNEQRSAKGGGGRQNVLASMGKSVSCLLDSYKRR